MSGMHTMAERRAKLLADMRALIPTLTLDEIEELLAMLRARVPAKAEAVEAALRGLLEALPKCSQRGCEETALWVCYDETCSQDLCCDAHKYEHDDIGGAFDNADSQPARWAAAVRAARAAVGPKETT